MQPFDDPGSDFQRFGPRNQQLHKKPGCKAHAYTSVSMGACTAACCLLCVTFDLVTISSTAHCQDPSNLATYYRQLPAPCNLAT